MFSAVWIEIPVKDVERARSFYQQVFQLPEAPINDDGERRTCTILGMSEENKGPGISLNQTANFEPSSSGVYVYLFAGDDLTETLTRVEAAGGKRITEKIYMEGAGHYATIEDTEGNHIGLYSVN